MLALILGGTGTVGRLTAAELLRRGHEVRALSRHAHPEGRRGGGSRGRSGGVPGTTRCVGDLATGTGLRKAIDGVDCVVDCSNIATRSADQAVRFFAESTARVSRMGAGAGVGHLVVLSIVGVDRAPYGYYQGKLRQEQVALAGRLPATVLRTTQFHEFVGQLVGRLRLGPVVPVPAGRIQPVAATEVAAALADLAERPPAGRVPDIGGPRAERFADLARAFVRTNKVRSLVVPLPLPGGIGAAMRDGSLLLGNGGVVRGDDYGTWARERSAGSEQGDAGSEQGDAAAEG